MLFPKYYTPKLGQTRKDNTPHECAVEEIDWYNNMLNSEQRAAVCSVLNGVARPTPYILFGPPGIYYKIHLTLFTPTWCLIPKW